MNKTRRLILLSMIWIFSIPVTLLAQQPFWKKTAGPYGTMINVVVSDSVGNYFAGTQNSGIYRSDDNASSWSPVNNGLPSQAWIDDIVMGPFDCIYAAVEGYGIYISRDGGNSWSKASTGLPGASSLGFIRITVSPEGFLYAIVKDKIFRASSLGRGIGWTRPGGTEPVYSNCIAANRLGQVFVGWNGGVVRTTDQGAHWAATGALNSNVHALCVDVTGDIWAGTDNGVYLSTNYGSSWSQKGLNQLVVTALTGNSAGYLYAGTANGVMTSTDRGGTWISATNGLTLLIRSINVDVNDNIIAGTSQGLFWSGDYGVSWELTNEGLTGGVLALTSDPHGNLFASLGRGSVSKSTDNGVTWSPTGVFDGWITALASNAQGNIFAGGFGRLYRSTDAGDTWNRTLNLSGVYDMFEIATTSSGVVIATTVPFSPGAVGTQVSRDTGKTWTDVSFPGGSILYAATSSSGEIAATTGTIIYVSTDGGSGWNAVPSPTSSAYDIRSIVYGKNNELYVSTTSGVCRSANRKGDWASIGPFPYYPQPLITINKEGCLFAAYDDGTVYYTNNNGETWIDASDGFETSQVEAILSLPNGHIAIASTTGLFMSLSTTNLAPAGIVVKDIPFDQGGYVNIRWIASFEDLKDRNNLSHYSVWRALPNVGGLGGATLASTKQDPPKGEVLSGKGVTRVAAGRAWEWMGDVPSHNFETYSFTAKTVFDSTSASKAWHYFLVSAHTLDEGIFFDSAVDSGYSVDNLAPGKLIGVTGKASGPNITLSWNPSPEKDLLRYAIFRSTSPNFAAQNLKPYAYANDTSFVDIAVGTNSHCLYAVKAQDVHENLSPFSSEISFGITNVESNGQGIPASFGLSQNFPNPFNPSTVISFQLSAISQVTLKIYDMLGKQVATLVSQELQAGYYSTKWMADVPSGVYLYRLEAGEAGNTAKRFVETRKMILLR